MEIADGEVVPLIMMLTTLAFIGREVIITIETGIYPKVREWYRARKGLNVVDDETARAIARARRANPGVVAQDNETTPNSTSAEAFGELMELADKPKVQSLNEFENAVVVKKSASIGGVKLPMDGSAEDGKVICGVKRVAVLNAGDERAPTGNIYDAQTAPKKGHFYKAVVRFCHALRDHVAWFNAAEEKYDDFEDLCRKSEDSGFLDFNDPDELDTIPAIKDFKHNETPGNRRGFDNWLRKSEMAIREVDDIISACIEQEDIKSVQLQISAYDLKKVIGAYSRRMLKKANRNAVSIIALAVPIRVKRRYFPVVAYLDNRSEEFRNFRSAINETVLNYVEDMEDRHGMLEAGDSATYALQQYVRHRRSLPLENADRVAYDGVLEEFTWIVTALNKRHDEAASRAGFSQDALCEVYLCIA